MSFVRNLAIAIVASGHDGVLWASGKALSLDEIRQIWVQVRAMWENARATFVAGPDRDRFEQLVVLAKRWQMRIRIARRYLPRLSSARVRTQFTAACELAKLELPCVYAQVVPTLVGALSQVRFSTVDRMRAVQALGVIPRPFLDPVHATLRDALQCQTPEVQNAMCRILSDLADVRSEDFGAGYIFDAVRQRTGTADFDWAS